MNGFEANPEELIAKGNRINTISNNYFDEKSKIYSTGEKIATAWQGADSSNYLNKLNEYEPEFKKLGDALTRISEILTKHGQNLVNTRDEIRNAASRL